MFLRWLWLIVMVLKLWACFYTSPDFSHHVRWIRIFGWAIWNCLVPSKRNWAYWRNGWVKGQGRSLQNGPRASESENVRKEPLKLKCSRSCWRIQGPTERTSGSRNWNSIQSSLFTLGRCVPRPCAFRPAECLLTVDSMTHWTEDSHPESCNMRFHQMPRATCHLRFRNCF